jgi:hypothetical protein
MLDGNGEFILLRRAKAKLEILEVFFFSATDDFGVKE